jgi:hypothetical protein
MVKKTPVTKSTHPNAYTMARFLEMLTPFTVAMFFLEGFCCKAFLIEMNFPEKQKRRLPSTGTRCLDPRLAHRLQNNLNSCRGLKVSVYDTQGFVTSGRFAE